MKVTNFKTYSMKKILSLVQNRASNIPNSHIPRGLGRSLALDETQTTIQLPHSSKLRERLAQNKAKLKKQSSQNRMLIRPEVLDALMVQPQASSKETSTLQAIPLKKYSNQDAYEKKDLERKAMRYLSNSRDPFFQVRNVNHYTILE